MLCHDELVDGARLAFTDRVAGVSPAPYDELNLSRHTGDDDGRVQANRELLGRALGLSAGELVLGRQVHGRRVRLVAGPSAAGRAGGLPGTDGLVTTSKGLAVVVLGADCLPVLVAGPGIVGAAHVGRAGLAAGVLPELLRVMRTRTTAPLVARIGPGICAGCYEVPEAMADEVAARVPGARSVTRDGRPSIDLAAGAAAQLAQAGLADIAVVGGCTLEQPERFFSFRRDGVTGRHAGVAVLT